MSSTGTWRKMLNLQGVSFIHRLQSTHFKQSSFLRICYFVTTIQLLLGHPFCKKSVLEDHTWQSLNKQQFWSWKRSTAIPTLEYSLHISAGLIRDTDHQLSKGILYCILQKQESDHKCAWFWSPSAHGNTFQTISFCSDIFDTMLHLDTPWTITTKTASFKNVFFLFLTFQNKMVWCFFHKNIKIRVIKRHLIYLSLPTTGIWHHLLQSTENVVKICNNILWCFTNICYHHR